MNEAKIDEAVLALLYLGLHDGVRAWKSFDWDATDRLHRRGLISNPATRAKSVVFTEEGLREAEDAFHRLPQIELAQQLRDAHTVMPGDALQDARQSLRPDRIVQRNYFMVFAAFPGGNAHVRAALTHVFVAQPTERRQERRAAHVSGQLHATRTSSRTKCSLIRRGRSMPSSK